MKTHYNKKVQKKKFNKISLINVNNKLIKRINTGIDVYSVFQKN